jgi:hypothetical protein
MTLSIAHTTQRRMLRRLLNTLYERPWKEAVVALLEVLSYHLPGEERRETQVRHLYVHLKSTPSSL